MRLSDFLKTMSMFTILALIYIHMQMQIFALAYQGKAKEKQLMRISEVNEMISSQILSLKSANHIGNQLLQQESKMRFRDNDSVVQLATAEAISGEENAVEQVRPKRTNPLLSFLSLRSEAEARALERSDLVKPWQKTR
jgi:hypothetical protein